MRDSEISTSNYIHSYKNVATRTITFNNLPSNKDNLIRQVYVD